MTQQAATAKKTVHLIIERQDGPNLLPIRRSLSSTTFQA